MSLSSAKLFVTLVYKTVKALRSRGKNDRQLEEVPSFVGNSADKSCAIVHPETTAEMKVYESYGSWTVRGYLSEQPSAQRKRALTKAGVRVSTQGMVMQFGPNRGKTIQIPTVGNEFADLRKASNAALAGVRVLAGVGEHEWLWITESEYDMRPETPSRPTGSPND